MGNDSQLSIIIRAKNEATAILNQTASQVKGLGSSVDSAMKAALPGSQAVALGLAAAGAAAVAFGVTSVKAFQESQDLIAQTNAVLKSTGGIAGVTATQIDALSKSLQSQTKFSDEDVRSAENLLLTFTSIGKDIFPQATKTVLDMSTALGEDTKSASIQLGKALQDPILGITALRRVGLNFSDDQKKVIENLVNTGQKAEAQKLILKELNTEFGGSATAAAGTFSGTLAQLSNSFNDLQEDVGGFIAQMAGPLVQSFAGVVGQISAAGGILAWLEGIWQRNRAVILIVGGAILGALVPALYAAAGGFVAMMTPLIPFILVGGLVAVMVDSLVKHFGGWGVAIDVVKNAFAPFNGVLAAFGAVLTTIGAFFDSHPIFSAIGLGAIGAVVLSVLVPAFIAWAVAAGSAAIATIAATWPILAIGAAIGAVAYLVVTNWATITAAFGAAVDWIGEKLTFMKDHFWEIIGFVLGFFATLPIKIPLYVAEAIYAAIAFLASVNWGNVLSGIGKAFSAAFEWVKNAAIGAFNYMASINWGQLLTNVGKGIGNAIIDLIQGAINGAFSGIPGAPKIRLPHFAGGVENFGGGMAVVGERGPEMVYLPKGSNVYPADQTAAMAGGVTNNFNGSINLGDESAVDRFFDRLNSDAANAAIGAAV